MIVYEPSFDRSDKKVKLDTKMKNFDFRIYLVAYFRFIHQRIITLIVYVNG